MAEIEIIRDATGEERRLGSWVNPDNFVCAFPTFESYLAGLGESPWDDAEIKRVITDPNRIPRRKVFGPSWIKNQRSKGSCNGWAGSAGYEKTRYLRGIQDKMFFSGSFLYSLMNGGSDNGSALQSGMQKLQEVGCAELEYADWDDIYPSQWKPGARENAAKHKGLICYAAGTIQGLKTGLAKGFVAIVAVHAGGNFQRLNSQGIAMVDAGRGNHAVHVDDLCIVGGTMVFDMPNSWGTGFGQAGRAYLTEDSLEQPWSNHTTYLIASTEEAE